MWGRRGYTGRLVRLGRVASVLVLALVSGLSGSAHPADGEAGLRAMGVPAPARQRQLIQMVRHDCGSCHGLTLAGGLGPALVPEALQGKPLDSLEAVILRGRPGTPMPGWQGLLSEEDARWIASQLQEGFPDAR